MWFRHVVLPPEIAKVLPKNRLLSEVSTDFLFFSNCFYKELQFFLGLWNIKRSLTNFNFCFVCEFYVGSKKICVGYVIWNFHFSWSMVNLNYGTHPPIWSKFTGNWEIWALCRTAYPKIYDSVVIESVGFIYSIFWSLVHIWCLIGTC